MNKLMHDQGVCRLAPDTSGVFIIRIQFGTEKKYLQFSFFCAVFCCLDSNCCFFFMFCILWNAVFRHGYTGSPSWLYEESPVALGGVCCGSVSDPKWLWEKSVTCWEWLLLLLVISQHDGLLVEPEQIFHRPTGLLLDFKCKKKKKIKSK